MLDFIKKVFDSNEREIKRCSDIVAQINALEPQMQALSDAELAAKTPEFRRRLEAGETLDDLLPEAFAVVREAAVRTLGQRHFDVQLIGGIVLHEGKIAEMKTGEGKTLAATAPAYLNALAGHGVHVVTVNDYLAKRDSEWMGQIYRFLGLKVGVILHDMDYAQRRAAYAADITYGTNNEFGFDYLRDNMVLSPEEMVQRELHYAIVDEVDSILIDEARTPLIISGQAEESTDLYYKFAQLVPRLVAGEDYTVDEKARTVAINESGVAKMEKWLGVSNLYDESNITLTHHLQQALRAHALMKRDRDYVVKDGQVIIVDEFTGRLMFGRRYSDGLHQAIEAKERVKIEHESQTLATITFQNYFRMYKKLAGMTGTAATEEPEFIKIYGLEVVVIPTNMPMIRRDLPDMVFKTEQAKYKAVVDRIVELHAKGQPVLVGTVSVEKSERLSEMLKRRGVPHEVLNAKYHEREAEIVAQAGRLGAVTIATNMAGRGTDIMLGGNPEFMARQKLRQEGVEPELVAAASEKLPSRDPQIAELQKRFQQYVAQFKVQTDAEHAEVVKRGGLYIIGTERHESRRIDNQLRGRSGRQGDPGTSQFFISLEDDLMRLFGSDRIRGFMDRLGWEEDMPIQNTQVARAIENAQKKVEAHNFDIRKQVLEYDDVMNQQREVIYAQRRKVLRGEHDPNTVRDMVVEVLKQGIHSFASKEAYPEDWDLKGLAEYINGVLGGVLVHPEDLQAANHDELVEKVTEVGRKLYEARRQQLGDQAGPIERFLLLRMIDMKWMDHLKAMDELREGIGLRAYGQRDPLVEYRLEAFNMFEAMVGQIQEDVVKYLFRVQFSQAQDQVQRQQARVRDLRTNREGGAAVSAGAPRQRRVKKVGRNDPCPCGSGKKYKYCCGR